MRVGDDVAALADVAVSLGGRPVLRGIDLTVRRGEFLALLGANGSGKSTLVRAMIGLVPTVRGSVRLVAAAATRLRSIEAEDLTPSDLSAWRVLRGRLERRQAVRTLGRRFRRDPVGYLRSLEDALINQALPS